MSIATLPCSPAWIRGRRRGPQAGASAARTCPTLAAGDVVPSTGKGARLLPLSVRAGLLTVTMVLTAIVADQARAQAVSETEAADIVLPPINVQTEAASRMIGGPPPGPCVEVDIAGHRAGHLDCATRALTEAARDARREAVAARDVSVAGAGSPDVQVGVASRAGARLRLRENFGISIRPPAAPPPVYSNPLGRKP
jgi:hypothetical protein